MKELSKKVFTTIFSLLTFFLFVGVFIFDIIYYNEEYYSIDRSLKIMNEDRHFEDNRTPPDMKNMIIMDQEVYSIEYYDNEIISINTHGINNSNFNVEEIAKNIINKYDYEKKYIGNLFINKYSFNTDGKGTIVIINNSSINKKLIKQFGLSIILFIVLDILMFYLSNIITFWITKPAEEAFNKQKDFIADASHELKTPLAVIIASSDELKSSKVNEKYIENIKYESERMNNLIKGLLDLSRLEKGVSISNYKDENISKIIEKISLTFESIAFEQSIKIDTNIEEDIIFKCSKEEIEKLISIILDNAIKHSYKDSTIKINAKKDKNNIDIEIINNGDPIKIGDEEKIFERFYRGDKSRNRDSNRYGLGLAIAKNIVTNHNGTIKAFSKDNFTTFKINLKK